MSTKVEHIVMDEDLIDTTLEFAGIEIEWAYWMVECSCGESFQDRLLSTARETWRGHAGVTKRRMVNDATVVSK